MLLVIVLRNTLWYCVYVYDMHGMLQRNSPQCYIVRTVHHHEHFQLWKFCSEMCRSCEGHSWSEGSVNVLIISCSFQLLKKDPFERLGTNSQVESVRQQPFFRGIEWRALLEKRVEPPHKPNIVQVTQTAFISCHKQLLLTLHVNWGNNSIVTSTPII